VGGAAPARRRAWRALAARGRRRDDLLAHAAVEAQPDRQRRPRHGVAQSRVRAAQVGRRRDGRAGSEGVVTERVERRQGTAALAPRVESFGAGDDDEKAACGVAAAAL
jgi:hypothetical protein